MEETIPWSLVRGTCQKGFRDVCQVDLKVSVRWIWRCLSDGFRGACQIGLEVPVR